MRRVAPLQAKQKKRNVATMRPAVLWHRSIPMMDILMAAMALAFFAAAIGYTYACERL
jgi:hypothetical protein